MRRLTMVLLCCWTTAPNKNVVRNVAVAFTSSWHPRVRPSSSHFASAVETDDPNYFLRQVETTVQKVLARHPESDNILQLQPNKREAVGVARHLNTRLQALRKSQDCPRCWMQRAHCICSQCPPIALPSTRIRRIFLLVHHKEIALKVDTAKLLLAAFPTHCRLVVGGIGPEYQDSMKELEQALQQQQEKNRCLVLFPDDHQNTATISEIINAQKENATLYNRDDDDYFDLVVLDGTWAQARKLHSRYIPSTSRRVQLSQTAVETLHETGHQLRRHSVAWKQVGTFEATRLFFKELSMAINNTNNSINHHPPKDAIPSWKQMEAYQEIANTAARRELGPPQTSR